MGGALSEHIREYLADRRATVSTGTVKADRFALVAFAAACHDKRPEDLTIRDVSRWVREVLEPWSPSTKRHRASQVRQFLRWLDLRGHGPPARVVESIPRWRVPRSVRRPLTDDEVRALLAACPTAREVAIVTTMSVIAARACEVANLELGDWDRLAHRVRLIGKGGHQRTTPTPQIVEESWADYLAMAPARSGPFFRSLHDDRSPLAASTISNLMTRLCWEAGIKRAAFDGVSGHSCRHRAATRAYERSRDLRVPQNLLGHRSKATTDLYVGDLPSEDLLRSTLDSLSSA